MDSGSQAPPQPPQPPARGSSHRQHARIARRLLSGADDRSHARERKSASPSQPLRSVPRLEAAELTLKALGQVTSEPGRESADDLRFVRQANAAAVRDAVLQKRSAASQLLNGSKLANVANTRDFSTST